MSFGVSNHSSSSLVLVSNQNENSFNEIINELDKQATRIIISKQIRQIQENFYSDNGDRGKTRVLKQ